MVVIEPVSVMFLMIKRFSIINFMILYRTTLLSMHYLLWTFKLQYFGWEYDNDLWNSATNIVG